MSSLFLSPSEIRGDFKIAIRETSRILTFAKGFSKVSSKTNIEDTKLNGQKLQALDGWDEVSLFQELQKFMKKHEVISFEIFLVPDVKEFSHETHGQKYYKYWWRCWVIYKDSDKK